MAMTKKEQAEMQALRDRDAMLRAISYPTFPEPAPIVIGSCDDVQVGYVIARAVEKRWRIRDIYYSNKTAAHLNAGGGWRNGGPLYATEQDAYRAMAFQVALAAGKKLAAIYAKCFEANDARAIDAKALVETAK